MVYDFGCSKSLIGVKSPYSFEQTGQRCRDCIEIDTRVLLIVIEAFEGQGSCRHLIKSAAIRPDVHSFIILFSGVSDLWSRVPSRSIPVLAFRIYVLDLDSPAKIADFDFKVVPQ